MSTKIYQACKLNTSNFKKILEMCNAFKPWLTAAAEKKMDDFIKMCDDNGKKGFNLWFELRADQKKTGQSMPLVDTDFSLSFIPYSRNTTLAIIYTDNNAWYNEWLAQPGVSEYGYWNNTDMPDEMTRREWNQRRRVWNKALNYNAVCTQAFSIDLMEPTGPHPKGWRT